MPAAPINDRNPLINVLRLGLLDAQNHPATGKEDGLDYGLSGRDVLSLQRTCHAAHDHLKMTLRAETNYLVRVTKSLRREAPSPRGMHCAKGYIAGYFSTSGVHPRQIYRALAEMSSLGSSVHFVHSTDEERLVAIKFATVMHSKSGYMTGCTNTEQYVKHMRKLDARVYGDFLKRQAALFCVEAAIFGVTAGGISGAYLLGCKALSTVAYGSMGAGKVAAVLSLPLWPLVAVQSALIAVEAVPFALGLGVVGTEIVVEAAAYSRINFYKDAVILDILLQPDSWLLHDHSVQDRLDYLDTRQPKSAHVAGQVVIKKISWALGI